ncbi:aldo/keto reductase [Oceanobacter kriegii]|uniref:aldo/keto reductase n=1 Tax=Oceanobacter kriegii TaxID=64972 RepID=UPI000417E6B2|nr:aldo/keto reductase [Oceanobacter kriegii]
MKQRQLGNSDLTVSAIGMGVMNLSYGTGKGVTEADGIRIIHQAIEMGVSLFDTAEAYGPYINEQLLGKALKGKRDQVSIASKFGFQLEDSQITGVNSRPENIRRAVESSLKRLDTDCIDLYYQHRVDPAVAIEEVAGTLKELIEEGKIRHYGLSEVGANTIRRAHAVHPVAAVQNQYSIWSREPEAEVLPVCEELGIGFVPWAPLGTGFLTGTIDTNSTFDSESDLRANFPRFTKDAIAANMPLVSMLRDIASRKEATPVQVALAWLLAQKPWIVPIPGMDKSEYLTENLAAERLALDANDLDEIEQRLSAINIQGARLDEGLLSLSE